MKVSFNELQGMGRKAFIGVGFAEGDAIDAAEVVAWMEAHNLGGVAALKKGLEDSPGQREKNDGIPLIMANHVDT